MKKAALIPSRKDNLGYLINYLIGSREVYINYSDQNESVLTFLEFAKRIDMAFIILNQFELDQERII